MPKFDPRERKAIQRKLEEEGERLFAAVGLKKVAIEDLTGAAGIAKASFYSFFASKEELFFRIVFTRQQEIFWAMDELLEQNRDKSARERIREVFAAMARLQAQCPVLQQISPAVVRALELRLPKESIDVLLQSNLRAVLAMQSRGIRFTCDPTVVSGVFLALYECWMNLMARDPSRTPEIIGILLEGALDRMVNEA